MWQRLFYSARQLASGRVVGLLCSSAVVSTRPVLDNFSVSTSLAKPKTNSNSTPPPVLVSRIATGPVKEPPGKQLDLRLYQFQVCPFCCKTRAFLDYYGFSYEVVEVNSVTKKQIKFSSYKKVPVLLARGRYNKQLNDSSAIISLLRSYTLDPSRDFNELALCYPEVVSKNEKGKDQIEVVNKYYIQEPFGQKVDVGFKREEREWREWADNVLVHIISPNIYRTFGEALDSFRWFSVAGNWENCFSAFDRAVIVYVGSSIMFLVSKNLKKKYNLNQDVRQSLYKACNDWLAAIGPNRKFMGGSKPSLADLAVYGVLTSMEGCAAFKDLLANTEISPWYYNVQKAIQNHEGAAEFQKALQKVK